MMGAMITIRDATAADMPFLWEMLYEAAFVPDDVRAEWRTQPEPPSGLRKYLDGWCRPGDVALIACDGPNAIGAAWYRLFPASDRGEGIMAEHDVPEVSIALAPQARGQGTGHTLLTALHERARAEGFRSIMLSVDPANERAVRLYERIGYVLVPTDDPAAGTSLIMVADLT
jgi:RimJ/RimL family protein N-acetyltransferase